ncbi:acyl carrier protein [Micromonospora haikouensis]|uniref:acyl carrier protein n=1 Tax=Micromonospora TaxID=1873 RepID=UPI00367CC084
MTTIDDFLAIVSAELGLPVRHEQVGLPLDSVPGWDSIHLLSLLTILERETGRQIALPAVLQATNLDEIYRAVVAE